MNRTGSSWALRLFCRLLSANMSTCIIDVKKLFNAGERAATSGVAPLHMKRNSFLANGSAGIGSFLKIRISSPENAPPARQALMRQLVTPFNSEPSKRVESRCVCVEERGTIRRLMAGDGIDEPKKREKKCWTKYSNTHRGWRLTLRRIKSMTRNEKC